MKKVLLLAILVTGVLAYFSLTAAYTRNNTDYKGWPIPYRQTEILNIDAGLCAGANLDLRRACSVVMPINNYLAAVGDVVLCAAAGLAISYSFYKLDRKNT